MAENVSVSEEQCCLPPTPIAINQQQIEEAATLFTALADPTRIAVLKLLADRQEEVCVCDITRNFRLGQPTISHHLKLLRMARLVSTSKRGKWVHYSLHPENAEKVRQLLRVTFAQPERTQRRMQTPAASPC